MSHIPGHVEIAAAFGYKPLSPEEGRDPACTELCICKVEDVDGWPHICWKGEQYPVPTMQELEDWAFDSVCPTPDDEDVEPDHPDSWLRILGVI